jgi:hypothetical protein
MLPEVRLKQRPDGRFVVNDQKMLLHRGLNSAAE